MEKEYQRKIIIDTNDVTAVCVFAKALVRMDQEKLATLSNLLWPALEEKDEEYRKARMVHIINCTARIAEATLQGLQPEIKAMILKRQQKGDGTHAEGKTADGEREEEPGRAGAVDRKNAGAAH